MTCVRRGALLLCILLCTLSCLYGCAGEESDQTIYYTITFNTNGGSAIEPQMVAAEHLATAVTPPTREGYIFDGWKTESGLLWNFEKDYPRADMTLTAVWTPAESVFGYEPIDDNTARITELKELRQTLDLPKILGGYTVTAIGDGVFAELLSHKVSSITLPSTITSIGEEAFYKCQDIAIVISPEAVLTDLGAGAFYGCNRLGSVSLGEGLDAILSDTFFGCSSLKEIRIPASVTRLEDNAFSDCSSLITVMLSPTLTEIGDSSFKGCTSLRAIYYFGTEAQMTTLRELGTEHQNDAFLRATVYYYSETKPAEDGNYWYLNEKDRPKLW